MAKVIGPFRDSQSPSWLSGLRTNVQTEPPFIGPVHRKYFEILF